MIPEFFNLSGKLLLAHPNLRDPNFRHSIVYVAKHDALTGAFGFIINRPISQTFEELDASGISPIFADAKLHLGGPVATDSVMLAMFDWNPMLKKLTVHHSIKTAGDDEDDLVTDPARTMALIGYSGWDAGQLEREIEENTWLIQDPNDARCDLLYSDHSTWKQLVSRIHPNFKLLAEMPNDPSLN